MPVLILGSFSSTVYALELEILEKRRQYPLLPPFVMVVEEDVNPRIEYRCCMQIHKENDGIGVTVFFQETSPTLEHETFWSEKRLGSTYLRHITTSEV